MNEYEIIVKYEEEFGQVHISDYHYNSCSYFIKSVNEIGQCINDFIKTYYEGK